ncbi:hypothetical protein [Parablautia intestinalis]|nr:hypothetical protein [Parablautia intestinalis]
MTQKRFTMYDNGTLFTQIRFTMCGRETLFTSLRCEPEAFFDKTSIDDGAQKRLGFYLNLPERDIRSCYYHIGRISSQSILFIRDAIPITDKYIDGVHIGGANRQYIIKNKNLLSESERKLLRILSVENTKNNSFRQHITDVKRFLLQELEFKN